MAILADAGEQIVVTSNVTRTGYTVSNFTIPVGTPNLQSFYARFRVCPSCNGNGSCNSAHSGQCSYTVKSKTTLWNFGPLAVTLESLQAQPVTTSPVLPLALVGGAAAILLGAVLFTRKSRKQSV